MSRGGDVALLETRGTVAFLLVRNVGSGSDLEPIRSNGVATLVALTR